MSKKATLSRSTALSNSEPMGVVKDEVIREQARLAFANKTDSDNLAGSAVQRLAYAVIAEHFTMNQGSAKLPALETVLANDQRPASPEASKAILDAMIEFFAPRPAIKVTGSSDPIEAEKAAQTAREQLLKRAIQVAAILSRANVQLDAFNADTGTFTVPCKLLLLPGEKPRGRILDNPMVALDGKPILISKLPTDGSTDRVDDKAQASITRLVRVCDPPKPRKAATPDTAPKVPEIVASLAQLIRSDEKPVHLVNLPLDVQRNLHAIVDWYTRESTVEAEAVKADKANGAKNKAA